MFNTILKCAEKIEEKSSKSNLLLPLTCGVVVASVIEIPFIVHYANKTSEQSDHSNCKTVKEFDDLKNELIDLKNKPVLIPDHSKLKNLMT